MMTWWQRVAHFGKTIIWPTMVEAPLSGTSFPQCSPALSLSPTTTEKLQRTYESICTKYHLPGLAGFAETDKGTVSVCTGVRKAGERNFMQHNDLHHLGSCTKAMTATLIAIQVQKGLLSWDSSLFSLFPELHNMDHSYRNVPVKMLTAHRSGISGDCGEFDEGRLWKALWNQKLKPTEGRALTARSVLTKPPAYPPNSKTEYSNFNYIIAGAILEKLTGKPWEHLIQEELFTPLGMTTCGFGAQAARPDQPWPHKEGAIPDFMEPVYPDFYADNPPSLGPAGTVHCSLADWSKFIRFHIDGFNGLPTPLLPASAFPILHQQFPGTEHTSGGWLRVERSWAGGPTLTHQGSNTMNFAVVWVAPRKKLSFVVACNVGCKNADKACDEGVVALLQAVNAL